MFAEQKPDNSKQTVTSGPSVASCCLGSHLCQELHLAGTRAMGILLCRPLVVGEWSLVTSQSCMGSIRSIGQQDSWTQSSNLFPPVIFPLGTTGKDGSRSSKTTGLRKALE